MSFGALSVFDVVRKEAASRITLCWISFLLHVFYRCTKMLVGFFRNILENARIIQP